MTGLERVIEKEFVCPICHNRVPEGREVYCYVCGGKVRPVLIDKTVEE